MSSPLLAVTTKHLTKPYQFLTIQVPLLISFKRLVVRAKNASNCEYFVSGS